MLITPIIETLKKSFDDAIKKHTIVIDFLAMADDRWKDYHPQALRGETNINSLSNTDR